MMTFRQCIFYCVVKCCDAMICVTQNLGAKMTADHLKSAGSPNLHGDYELRMRCGIELFIDHVGTYMCLCCLPVAQMTLSFLIRYWNSTQGTISKWNRLFCEPRCLRIRSVVTIPCLFVRVQLTLCLAVSIRKRVCSLQTQSIYLHACMHDKYIY